MTIKKSTIAIIALVIISIIGLSVYLLWNRLYSPASISKTQFTAASKNPVASKIPTERKPVKDVVVYDKKVVSKKFKLPDDIALDDNKQITDMVQAPATDTAGKTDFLAVLNTETGETDIVAKEQPLPWFAFKNQAAIGGAYGFSSRSDTNYEADAYARWEFLQIKSVHVELYGEVSFRGSESDERVLIRVEYRFKPSNKD
jgi:hypothetical protein